ncbi:MAG: MFS transporter [Candidatus Methanoliparum thermophilum]|uniref:MFS transporter n=1 Tax=Methanoliparum thermophilum TaxID=2491083 RepID=A0A520KQY0_METT2|nr:MFS transporter [Candidatus Methanoliparum sp. LAM-1]RZN63926.1 MAG: MFS transporter [Candidatus Methanoliparum thermophilum]BDC36344.1 MFS transporter [Candidatus Methanoliparum sp. LAM-1]
MNNDIKIDNKQRQYKEDKINKERKLYKDRNLLIVFCITLTAVLSVTSISPAFPMIADVFNISDTQIGLLITVFTLPGIILAPIIGILADRLGRKKVLVPSLILFGIAGTSCIFARSFKMLLSLRLIQGIGGAAINSLNNTIIGDLYRDKECTIAMGYNATVLNIGTTAFPLIGGALCALGWYYPFFLPLVAIPIAILVVFALDSYDPDNNQDFKKYLKNSMQVLKNKNIIILIIISCLLFTIFYGVYMAYFPIYIDKSFNPTPLQIGIILAGMSFTTAAVASQLGRLSSKFSVKTLLIMGFAFFGIALLIIPIIPTIWLLFLPIIIYGIGQGISNPMIQSSLARLSDQEYRGIIMSLSGMSIRLGQTLGPVLFGLIVAISGIDYVFYAGVMSSLIVVLVIFKIYSNNYTTD